MKKDKKFREILRNNILNLILFLVLISLVGVIAGNVIVREGKVDSDSLKISGNITAGTTSRAVIGNDAGSKSGYFDNSATGEYVSLVDASTGKGITTNRDILISADSRKLMFGASQNSEIYFDGVNLIVKSNKTGPNYPLTWFSANISTTGVNTRTSIYDKSQGRALDKIQDANYYKNPEGSINHSAFYGYVTYLVRNPDDCSQNANNETECGSKSEEGVSLNMEIDVLRQAIYELKQEICALNSSSEICS